MEGARATWTDERLDDLSRSVDHIHADLRSINERMDEGFRATNARVDNLGAELGVRIDALQRTMIQMMGGTIGVTVLTLISVLANGA